MLYYKTRNSKFPLDAIASSDSAGGGLVNDLKVDKNYQPSSPNAQAGTAVAEAVKTVETTINSKYGEVMRYKGSVETYDKLPTTNKTRGDVYNVNVDNANYAWDGTKWDKLNENLDGYVKNTTFQQLETKFNNHKGNQDTVKHLTDTLLQKLTSLEVFTQEQLRQQIESAITSAFSTQGIITNTQLQAKLKELQSQIETNVTSSITSSFSSTYTSNSDFETYKVQQAKAMEAFIKCDEADMLKIYKPTETPSAPALVNRDTRTLYILGGMTA